ncbi:hypothetical protein DUNSADRAFT_13832 [Dunaliella salina]|uniref:SREBP regulating gene protein n=1 Tax=Dunaliella salina TaxID=3046 RepID=A0ABQ7G8I3_DUNSA|nr:hypothetical protein DUNSADRAFT_13832 [Dunaliella salina]|eukprot:KAF5830924.1 hypothetical protein DUNSADRAFT_13832 [Dunaliella salina]
MDRFHSSWHSIVPLLLFLTYSLHAEGQQAALQGARKLLREFPSSSSGVKQCRNTAAGLLYITDELGFMCSREEVDSHTGCCRAGTQHSCDKCTLTDKCCSEYESCVSCCLAPKHEAGKISKSTLRFPSFPQAGTWSDAWEYCSGTCRTHKGSTVHENDYISDRHHCFSTLRRPMLSDPLPPDALEGVAMVVSEPNQDCEQACSKSRKRCSPKHMKLLNSCDRLREKVGCEAGCEASRESTVATAAPGYVSPKAPKAKRPAMCFTAADKAGDVQCGGKEQHMQRLCACELRGPPSWGDFVG